MALETTQSSTSGESSLFPKFFLFGVGIFLLQVVVQTIYSLQLDIFPTTSSSPRHMDLLSTVFLSLQLLTIVVVVILGNHVLFTEVDLERIMVDRKLQSRHFQVALSVLLILELVIVLTASFWLELAESSHLAHGLLLQVGSAELVSFIGSPSQFDFFAFIDQGVMVIVIHQTFYLLIYILALVSEYAVRSRKSAN